jgi:hypothetical protein
MITYSIGWSRAEAHAEITELGADGSMWTEQRRLTRYRVVIAEWASGQKYQVQRKKWWSLRWVRCQGLHWDLFTSVEEAKKAIPLYDKGAAYWIGTMVDLTKERIGVSNG